MAFPAMGQLEPEQVEAVDASLEASCIVTGPPGSGKTVVALHRAQRAHELGKGTRLIMFNNVLQSYTQQEAGKLQLAGEQTTFHRWFRGFYRGMTGSPPPVLDANKPFIYDWNAILSSLTQKDLTPDSNIDALIDEGQDLPNEFYILANQLGATVTIFADENQRITEQQSTLRQIQDFSGIQRLFRLKKNYRNTREIAALANSIASSLEAPTIPGDHATVADLSDDRASKPPGDKPWLILSSSLQDTVNLILEEEERNQGWHIGVLTSNNVLQRSLLRGIARQKRSMSNALANRPAQFYRSNMDPGDSAKINWNEPSIKLIHYQSAKGIEFDEVILPELQDLPGSMSDPTEPTTAMLFYVAVTRARESLILSYSGSGVPRIMNLFPRELLKTTDEN